MNARAAADVFFESALSTADPHLQAQAWEQQTPDHGGKQFENRARGHSKALPIVDKFEIFVARSQVHATASELYRKTKEH